MAITVECPNCGVALKVNDDLAGKKARCPQCSAIMEIPGLRPTVPVDSVPAPPEAPQSGKKLSEKLDSVYEQLDKDAGEISLFEGEQVLSKAKGLLGVQVRNPISRLILSFVRFIAALLGSRVICHLYVTDQRLIFNTIGAKLFGIWGRSRGEFSIPLDSVAYFGWNGDTRFLHLIRSYNLEVQSNGGGAFRMHLDLKKEEEVRELASQVNVLIQQAKGRQ